ncbi:YwdI family protein [Lentibacillus sp. N15]|uniref:YwdI family protein n=1 Tax=Lentibacillus songyuanensis TaxID=3136161 RepID=UPI0031BA44E6
MAVTDRTVLQKMIKEAQQANEKQANHQEMLKHVANVSLLCELLLEGNELPTVTRDEISADEMKAMTGTVHPPAKQPTLDHDDANGKSIFDF